MMSYLQELLSDDQEFKNAKSMLLGSWVKNNVTDLNVERIFRIVYPEKIRKRYHDYREYLSAELGVETLHQYRLFHGTSFQCQLADKPADQLCKDNCEGCNIVRMSFKMACVGKNRRASKWQRLGHGIYFSPYASKCHYYSGTRVSTLSSNPHRQVRGMFLTDVVLGRMYTPSNMELNRKSLPSGYHSIYGKAGNCGLNYDEYAIFDEEACLPVFLYVYSYKSSTE
ncbi:hypothetical protein BDF22DRAFT_755352 [Syncephalis plumigaleata]|nr:hypothetical protein BDF22DRAFT_755352 [Syncephalis plumigaleata]